MTAPSIPGKRVAAWLGLVALLLGLAPLSARALDETPAGLIFTLLSWRTDPAVVIDVDPVGKSGRFRLPDGKVLEMVLSLDVRHLRDATPGRAVTIHYDEIVVARHFARGSREQHAEPGRDVLRFTVSAVDHELGRVWLVDESGGEIRAYDFAAFIWDEEIQHVRPGDTLEGILIRALVDIGPSIGLGAGVLAVFRTSMMLHWPHRFSGGQ